jgi:hypothetical protein
MVWLGGFSSEMSLVRMTGLPEGKGFSGAILVVGALRNHSGEVGGKNVFAWQAPKSKTQVSQLPKVR